MLVDATPRQGPNQIDKKSFGTTVAAAGNAVK
jgi:hypothetical protein